MSSTPSPAPIVCVGHGASHLREAFGDAELAPVERREFPDGELCVRVDADMRDRAVVVLQGTGPPQHRHLMELFQLVDVAASGGAAAVACAVPYLAYARQDHRSAPGEPASLEIVGRALAGLGVGRLATVDAHGFEALRRLPLAATDLETTELVAGHVARVAARAGCEVVVVAPDAGRAERARAVAARVGCACLSLAKRKARGGRTWYDPHGGPPLQPHAVVVDDVCSSGSTLLPLAEHLAGRGVRSLELVVTHLLGDPLALEARSPLPLTITATNTLPNPRARLDVGPLLRAWAGRATASSVSGT